jgi:nicotinate-nucleotide adenylyltransferase
MGASRRIGILGGTFDPIHHGHLDLGIAAQQALGLTRLLVVPANAPPHRLQPFASAFHRFAMVALAVAGRPGWCASDLELQRGAPSYTSTTLWSLHELGYAPTELFFVLGADAFVDIGAWKDYPQLLAGAHFAVVSRPGYQVDDLPGRLPALASRMVRVAAATEGFPPSDPSIILIDALTADVSSTAVRRRRAEGHRITGLVVRGVEQHIEQHGLYLATFHDGGQDSRPTSPAADRLHGQS